MSDIKVWNDDLNDLMKHLRKSSVAYHDQIVMNFLVLFFATILLLTDLLLLTQKIFCVSSPYVAVADLRKITSDIIRIGNNRIAEIFAKSVFPRARCVTQCLTLT